MSMEYLKGQLEATGDPRDQERADVIAAMLEHRGEDIPMPQVAAAKETTLIEVKRFSREAKEALRNQGYSVHELTGQSIATVRDSGRKLWSTWHRDYPDFEALPSMHSEVAINPSALFLLKSNNKTLRQ